MAEDNDVKTRLALLEQAFGHLKERVEENMATYVTHDQFYSVRLLTHGLAGMILTGVVGALIASVMK